MEVTIRPQRVSDADKSWLMRKNREVWKYAICESPYGPLTHETETNFYKEHVERDDCIRFAVIADGEYVGNVFIDKIFNGNGELRTHIFLKEYWGKGIGYECNRLILEYAFRVAKMNCVYQYISHDNIANIRNAAKLGFECVGIKDINPDVEHFKINREQWIKESK